MAKMHTNGRTKKFARYIKIPFSLIESDAWSSLSPHGQALWIHIRHRYWGANNGEIPMSVREAAMYLNCSKDRAKKAFDEILDRGFVRVMKDSSFHYKARFSRRFALTDEPVDNNKPTEDFKAWKKPEPSTMSELHRSPYRTDPTSGDLD